MKLTEACINKPVFAWMLMAGTVLFGIVAASRIGISQMPDVDFPAINVSVNWEGAAPEVVENDVLQPLEEALVQVEGVTGLTSTARQGGGPVTVELGTNTILGARPERIAEIPGLLGGAAPTEPIPLWDGRAGARAAEVLLGYLGRDA